MTTSPWTGTVPVDDTALAVTDTGGTGPPLVYLNGSYAGQRHWRRTIGELGGDYRHTPAATRCTASPTETGRYSPTAPARSCAGTPSWVSRPTSSPASGRVSSWPGRWHRSSSRDS